MGFTHYWSFSKGKSRAADLETRYQAAIADCGRVIRAYNRRALFSEDRLSGYTAHTKVGQYGGINVNGKGDLSHETFSLREHFNQNEPNFCKTARKPYDLVVVACLAILKHHLGDNVNVSSDGDSTDWIDGVKFASSVLRKKVTNPIEDKAFIGQSVKIVDPFQVRRT